MRGYYRCRNCQTVTYLDFNQYTGTPQELLDRASEYKEELMTSVHFCTLDGKLGVGVSDLIFMSREGSDVDDERG